MIVRLAVASVLLLAPLAAAHAASVQRPPQPLTVAPVAPSPAKPPAPAIATPPAVFVLTPQQTATLKGLGTGYARTGNAAALQAGWNAFLGGAALPAGADIDQLVQLVMFQAAAEADADLKAAMAKVQALVDRKKALRDEIQKMRDYESAVARGQRPPPTPPKLSGVIAGVAPVASAKDAAAYRVRLEAALNALGDDAQLANVDLQNVLQKQQQTLQMMSNISKMLHDTAQAVIRKIGG